VIPRLRGAPVLYRASHARPLVALTFDDGPSEWTPAIAAALERHGCKGTFFLLGPAVERDPATVRALAAAGHELASHLWTHANPEAMGHAAIRDEDGRTRAAIAAAAGVAATLVRPPYCAAPKRVARAVPRGSTVVLRDVDPEDWRAEDPKRVVAAVLGTIRPGAIVCLHDGIAPGNRGTRTREVTAAALSALVPALLERGLRPVTVSELLAR
jgi:peptidoglycan/xylan/chitin deacetylase (PgdA/CDA1 family)